MGVASIHPCCALHVNSPLLYFVVHNNNYYICCREREGVELLGVFVSSELSRHPRLNYVNPLTTCGRLLAACHDPIEMSNWGHGDNKELQDYCMHGLRVNFSRRLRSKDVNF